MRVDMEGLEKKVRDFNRHIIADTKSHEEMQKVTEGREPLPRDAYENLVLTEEQQKSIFIFESDREAGKTGFSGIAALLTVHPDDYSDWQYYKVLRKRLHKMTLQELDFAIRDERMNQGIFVGDYIEYEPGESPFLDF